MEKNPSVSRITTIVTSATWEWNRKLKIENQSFYIQLLLLALPVLLVAGSAFAVPSGYTLDYETSAGNVPFSGKIHAEVDNTCIDCHYKIFKMKKGDSGMKAPHVPGVSCGTCHDGSVTFSVEDVNGCKKCHTTGG
jgi:c(7)-type cytochrome triheme protein